MNTEANSMDVKLQQKKKNLKISLLSLNLQIAFIIIFLMKHKST